MNGTTHDDWNITVIQDMFRRGMTWDAIAKKHGASRHSMMNWVRRRSRPGTWPIRRTPELESRMRSEWMRESVKSVDTTIIIDLLEEYLVENDMTMAEFGRTRLGMKKRTQINQLYEYRTKKKTRISGARAATILRAIGEPVPKRLKSAA